MFKRAVLEPTLVHLLVVLLLVVVVESQPCLHCDVHFHLRHIPIDALLTKLTSGPLEPERVYGLLKAGKKHEKIGEATLEQLTELNSIHKINCLGGSFAERQAVCDGATKALVANVIKYCRDRLIKQAQYCVKHSDLIIGAILWSDRDENKETLDFFRGVMKGHFDDEQDKHKLLIDNIVGNYNWQQAQTVEERKRNPKGAISAKRLKEKCKVLTEELDEVETIFNYAEEHADSHLDPGSKGLAWTHVYQMCTYFLSNYGKLKSDSDLSNETTEQTAPAR